MMPRSWRLGSAACLLLLPLPCLAADLPEGAGLAARYPGDRGLARHRSVVFAERFDEGDLRAVVQRWDDARNGDKEILELVAGGPKAESRGRCLQVTATLRENTGGYLYKRLSPGLERAWFRFYVKFAEEADYIHHFVHMGGYHPATSYPQGGAGERPQGHERITVGIEPYGNYGRHPAPGAWHFYAYWQEMKASAGGKFWGNGLKAATPLLVPRGRWQCVEVMLAMNSRPERADGELALWLDGELALWLGPGVKIGPWTGMGFQVKEEEGRAFEGFRWRSDPELKINFFWLLHYVTPGAARQNRVAHPHLTNRVWFDNIVVATEYIGPMP